LEAALADDYDFGCFRITLFLTLLLINITEATYIRGDHHLWLILMIITWQVPLARETVPTYQASESLGTDESAGDPIGEGPKVFARD